MVWLALGGIGLLGIIALLRAFATARIDTIRKAGTWGLAALGAALVVLLVASGRAGQVLWSGMLFAPLLLRWGRGWLAARRFGAAPAEPRGGAEGESAVETATLRLRLDHASGAMQGEVRRGRQAGRALGDLTLAETLALLAECRGEDPDSVPLLEAWLDRAEPEWRAAEATRPGAGAAPGKMTSEEALAVLGLTAGADAAAIRAAHLRLMRAAHPDHGGSDWLAARINQARDVLLP